MDAFELLKADHKKVADLFERLDAASGKAKLDLFKQINDELEVHTYLEETIFYPAVEKPEETHDLTLEAYEEHKVVKTLLAELSGARAADDEWQAKTKVLRENVEHHVDEEENELFDKADDALTDEQIEALGEQMEAAKAKRLGQQVPKPSSAKAAQTSKTSAEKPGLLSKIAGLVGLGGGAQKKKAVKKTGVTKKAAKQKASKTPVKKTASKSNKRAAGSTARKTAAKSQTRSSRATKLSRGAGAKKQATKKRGSRK